MTFDWSVIITASLAVAAIVSPVIVALINSHHNYKVRKLELATENKIEKFENYSIALIRYLDDQSESNYKSLMTWYQQTAIYVSPRTLKTMQKINLLLSSNKADEVYAHYVNKICEELQKDLGVYKRRK